MAAAPCSRCSAFSAQYGHRKEGGEDGGRGGEEREVAYALSVCQLARDDPAERHDLHAARTRLVCAHCRQRRRGGWGRGRARAHKDHRRRLRAPKPSKHSLILIGSRAW